jgi:hypothetical protein
MKISMLIIATFIFIGSAVLVGCDTAAGEMEGAKITIEETNNDLDRANEAYLKDIIRYKIETANRIAANEKSIAASRANIANEKANAKAGYNERIAALEKRTNDLKTKMANYKNEGKERWQVFKVAFTYDMNELTKSFNDFSVKNIK